jgi:hypothetical protein
MDNLQSSEVRETGALSPAGGAPTRPKR